MTVIAWVGGVTALLAGTVAILQPDIKRVLAYSTISQLGYMFLAVGIGAYSAAVFMVVCHAFYKGCLFLGAGSVIHGNHDNQDMRIMGRFRKFLPYTAFGMVVAWLAIAGLPPLSGFFSKDEIISTAFIDDDYGLWIIALVAAVFTGFYMTRLIFLTFYGNERWQPATEAEEAAQGELAHAVTTEDLADSDPSPTVSYGDAGRRSPQRASAARVAVDHGAPDPHARRTRRGRGIHQSPVQELGVVRRLARTVVPSRPDRPTVVVRPGPDARDGVGRARAHRHHDRVPVVPQGSGARRSRSRSTPSSARSLRSSGTPTTTTTPSRSSSTVPGRGFAGFLDRVVDQKIIDGTVDGIGGLVKRGALGIRHVQDGLVRRYALGIALGAVALLLYLVVRAG